MNPIFEVAVMVTSAARVTYTVTSDDIFRPLREAIYKRSAPENDTIRIDDQDVPARMVHAGHYNVVDGVWDKGAAVLIARTVYRFLPQEEPRPAGWWGSLISCPYCFSFWVALAWFALWLLLGETWVWIATPLALWFMANTLAVKAL